MRKHKVGIIGLGVGEQHLIGYRDVAGVEVAALCDFDPKKLEEVGDRHGIAERYTDWRKITEHEDIDIVSVCSYDNYHADQCLSAFRHGKHVLVEKPVVLHRHEAEALLKAQQDSGKLITSNLILRQSPRFRMVKQQVESGAFGDVFCIEGGYIHQILWKITDGWRGKMPFYSTLFGGGIHLIDLMRWILGQEITEVCGMGNKVLTRNTAYKFDDTFLHLLRFEGGAIGRCLSTLGPARTKFHELTVYGSKRTFVNDLPFGKAFSGDRPEDESVVETPYPGMEKGDLIPDFIDAIDTGREPNVTAKDVFRVMDICFAAMDSVEQRKTVSVSYMI